MCFIVLIVCSAVASNHYLIGVADLVALPLTQVCLYGVILEGQTRKVLVS